MMSRAQVFMSCDVMRVEVKVMICVQVYMGSSDMM